MNMTEAEATSNDGRPFQPADRVAIKNSTGERAGTVAGNRYFEDDDVYCALVVMDGTVYPRYINEANLRHV